jgi:CheY-like chemotaxis protein
LVGSVVREAGCTVFEADAPCGAFEIIAAERPIDLLLVDYAMPEINGVAVIQRARTHQCGLGALLRSGHAGLRHADGAPGSRFLAKPFKAAELRRRIAGLLIAGQAAADPVDHGSGHVAALA